MQQANVGMEGLTLATHHDAAGKAERTVEPCGENGATIDLGVQPQQARFAHHLCLRLDAEAGAVGVGAYHAEACLCHRTTPDAHEIERGIILRNHQLHARSKLRKGVGSIHEDETGCCGAAFQLCHSEEIHGRLVKKLHEVLHECLLLFVQ